MRGEYQGPNEPFLMALELPPRARRIHWIDHRSFIDLGTTSACAENTLARKHTKLFGRNYLRVRGEY